MMTPVQVLVAYVSVAGAMIGTLGVLLIVAHLACKRGWRPKLAALVLFLVLAAVPTLTGWGPLS